MNRILSAPLLISEEQVARYYRDGFLFPIPVLTDDEVQAYRSELEGLESHFGGRLSPQKLVQPHLHFRWAYELALHPRILDAVEQIIGPNIIVHTSSVFCKYPNDRAFISWHQDGFYYRLSSPIMVSAWIALSPSNRHNGCMKILPGTHGEIQPHVERRHEDNLLASGLTIQAEIDSSGAVDIILNAGEMSLHHVNSIHGSESNYSGETRLGFVMRYAAPQLTQALPHHEVVLARGRDDHGHFKLLEKPPGNDIQKSLVAQAEFARMIRDSRLSSKTEKS